MMDSGDPSLAPESLQLFDNEYMCIQSLWRHNKPTQVGSMKQQQSAFVISSPGSGSAWGCLCSSHSGSLVQL